MKTERILAYAIGGIIAGLIIENTGLRARQNLTAKFNGLKKKTRQMKEEVSSKLG